MNLALLRDKKVVILVAGLLVSMLVFSPFALDAHLTPRAAFLSLTFALLALTMFRDWRSISFRADTVTVMYMLFTIWSACCVSGAINTAEAIFDLTRTTLGITVYLSALIMLGRHGNAFFVLLRYAILLSFIVTVTAMMIQVLRVQSIDKASTYLFTGLNAHKNLLASFVLLSIPFLASGIADHRGMARTGFAVAVVIAFATIALLRSKSAATGVVAGACVFALSGIRRKKAGGMTWSFGAIVLLSACAICGIAWLLPAVLNTGEGASILSKAHAILSRVDDERLQLWSKTYYVIDKAPFTGIGPGNWAIHFPDATLNGIWRAEDLNFTFQRPHNDWLWIAAETGYIGLTLFTVWFIATAILLRKSISLETGSERLTSRLVLAAICGYGVAAFFDFPKERVEHTIVFNLLMAFACWRVRINQPATFAGPRFLVRPAAFLLPLALLVVCFLVSILRHKGEAFTSVIYDARIKGDAGAVMSAASSAEGLFYTVDPTTMPIAWYSGNACAQRGDYPSALTKFRRAYRLHPFNRHVLNDLGSALVFAGKTDSAKIFYREASRISPRFDESKLNLAALLIKEKRYSSADSCLNTLMHDSERRTKYQELVSRNLQAR